MANWKLLAGLGVLALAVATCERVPLTAAPGSTITLIANPSFVAANGGRSLITAILVEPAATFVPDGTEVFFFTDLGQIEASAKSVNGVARTYFVADARSGTATVTALSGGAAPSAAPTASPTPSADTGTSSGTGTGTASVKIAVGSKVPAKVVVTANPQVLGGSRQSTITANVFDDFGNPVQNVPVIFTLTAVGAAPVQEFLSSGGAPQFTDSNGQAFDLLTTRAPNGVDQKTVQVTATLPTAVAPGTVELFILYNATP